MAGATPDACKIVSYLARPQNAGPPQVIVEESNGMPIQARWPLQAAWQCFRRDAVLRGWVASGLAMALAAGGALFSNPALAAHGFALHGDLKYQADFRQFDYANPNAPAGGTLTLANPDRRTSFDKFNPFTLKGTSAPGLNALMFESLLISSADESASAYGLLAEDVTVAPDELSVTFTIRPQARFTNGDPVLASDVKYSYDMLMSKASSPGYRSMCTDVKAVIVAGERTVRFEFKQRNRELPLIVGSLPVFSKKWTAKVPFEKLTFEPPVTSGPYLIERYDAGRGIIFQRDPKYWGKDLAVRRGTFNSRAWPTACTRTRPPSSRLSRQGSSTPSSNTRPRTGPRATRHPLSQRRAAEDRVPAPQRCRHAGLRDEYAQAGVPGRARAPGPDPCA